MTTPLSLVLLGWRHRVYVASAVAGVVRLASYIVYVASAVAGVVRLAS